MRKPKIHNRISRSIFTFPACVLVAVLLWWWPQLAYSHDYAVGLVLVLFISLVLLEMGNRNQLYRVQTRMLPSVWLFAAACIPVLHPFHYALLGTSFLVISYYLLFRTYQVAEPVFIVFYTFLMLSLGSLFVPHMLLLVPFYVWYLIVFMRAFSVRVLFAALMGILLPFWFWLGWILLQEDTTALLAWYTRLVNINTGGVGAFLHPAPPMFAFYLIAILTVWMSSYYVRNSFDDKIQTRMYFYIFIFQSLLLLAYGILVDAATALPMLLLSVSPLAAHYFTLRETWLSLIFFVLTLLSFVAINL